MTVGPDSVVAAAGPDGVVAGAEPDSVVAGARPDGVVAGAGPDSVVAGAGPDGVLAGAGPDSVVAGAGPDGVARNTCTGVTVAPRISVIVCTCRRHAVLGACLAALGAQTLARADREIIVVDNSADRPATEAFAWPDEVRLIVADRPGLSHARNMGVAAARAPVVAFIDDDAIAAPDWLAAILRAFDETPRVAPNGVASNGVAPVGAETVGAGMAVVAPVGVAPVGVAPVGTGPVGTGPVGTGPVGTGPVGTGPVGTGPVGTGPVEAGTVGAGAVGGRVLPVWAAPPPPWLDAWHDGFLSIVDRGPDARNLEPAEWLAGTNIAFAADALRDGPAPFAEQLGRFPGKLLGNEEIALLARLHAAGRPVRYDPRIVVHHTIPAERLTQAWMRSRVAWQAISDLMLDDASGGRDPGGARHGAEIKLLWSRVSRYLQRLPPAWRGPAGLLRDEADAAGFRAQNEAIAALIHLLAGHGESVEQALLGGRDTAPPAPLASGT